MSNLTKSTMEPEIEMVINIPVEVEYIIKKLESSNFDAYVVGGCVRDSLLGAVPKDWDVCTSALPEETMEIFSNDHIIETGLKHGTITVIHDSKPVEITTFRVDGKYKDNRRPESVKYVTVLKRDLARRDFSINAMAYNPKTGIIDYYDGYRDLLNKKIKTVGNPDKRFSEDALRIMRAIRFSSQLGYDIEELTAKSMIENKKLLNNIASERIAAELNLILLGDNVYRILSANLPVLCEIIPEFNKCINFEQNNSYHIYDVMTHTLVSIDAAPKDPVIRLALLLHDIAKPECFSASDDGICHFYGHEQLSAEMARVILNRLRYDKDTINAVTELISYHYSEGLFATAKNIKRWLNRIGEKRLRQLLEVKYADSMAKSDYRRDIEIEKLREIPPKIDEIIETQACFSLKDLAVNGRDLIDIGITEGTLVGDTLKKLVDMVIDEEIENEKEVLLQIAAEIKKS